MSKPPRRPLPNVSPQLRLLQRRAEVLNDRALEAGDRGYDADADDAVQVVAVRLHLNPQPYTNAQVLKATRNARVDLRRAAKADRTAAVTDFEALHFSPDQATRDLAGLYLTDNVRPDAGLDYRDLLDVVVDAAGIDADDPNDVNLRLLNLTSDGLDSKAVGLALGLSPAAVRKRLERIRAAVSERLAA